MENNSYLSNYMALDVITVMKDFLWIPFKSQSCVHIFNISEGETQPVLLLIHIPGTKGKQNQIYLLRSGGQVPHRDKIRHIYFGELPWWSGGQDSMPPMQGAVVPSLVRKVDTICYN